jgi:hypothetical protein
MARARYYDVPVFADINTGLLYKLSSIRVTVYEQGTTIPIGDVLYQGDTGGATLPNPFDVTNGEVEFFLDLEQRVSIKFDGSLSGSQYGSVTRNMEGVWPDPGTLRTILKSVYDSSLEFKYDSSGNLYGPGQMSKYRGWDLEVDGGLIPGSAAQSTLNETKWETLRDEIADRGGGDVWVRQPFYLNSFDLNHGKGASVNDRRPINVYASPDSGSFTFVGSSGPFMDMGLTENDSMRDNVIQDLKILHNNEVNLGSTVRIGEFIINPQFERFKIFDGGRPDDGILPGVLPDRGSLINIEAKVGFILKDSNLQTRTDQEFLTLGQVRNILMVNPAYQVGGFTIINSTLNGCMNKSYSIDYAGAGVLDTPVMQRCLVKDHERGMNMNLGSVGSAVVNGQFHTMYFDGITGTGIYLQPANGTSFGHHTFMGLWMNCLDHYIWCSSDNNGLVSDLSFIGGELKDALLTGIYIQGGGGFYNFKFHDLDLINTGINAGTEYGMLIGDASGAVRVVSVKGNTVYVGASAGASARFSSGASAITVADNLWAGKAAIQGFTDNAENSYQDNRFTASIP